MNNFGTNIETPELTTLFNLDRGRMSPLVTSSISICATFFHGKFVLIVLNCISTNLMRSTKFLSLEWLRNFNLNYFKLNDFKCNNNDWNNFVWCNFDFTTSYGINLNGIITNAKKLKCNNSELSYFEWS